jgi:excisionase family DNA binding protein
MGIYQRLSNGKEIDNSLSQAIVRAERKVRYYTTSQLAIRWGVSAVTVIRLIEQGDLSGLKIRGSYRISKRSIKTYESKVAF